MEKTLKRRAEKVPGNTHESEYCPSFIAPTLRTKLQLPHTPLPGQSPAMSPGLLNLSDDAGKGEHIQSAIMESAIIDLGMSRCYDWQ
jgi:hypothetical protein